MSAGSYIDNAVLVEFGFGGFILSCKLCFCKHHIHIDNGVVAVRYSVRAPFDLIGKIAQNLFDFKLLVDKFDFEFVVEFYDLHRLDKKRRARSGLVVYKPRNSAFAVAFDRYDVSVASDCDDIVLQILRILRRSDEKLQFAAHVVVELAYANADCSKFVRCVVGNFRFAQKSVENLFSRVSFSKSPIAISASKGQSFTLSMVYLSRLETRKDLPTFIISGIARVAPFWL